MGVYFKLWVGNLFYIYTLKCPLTFDVEKYVKLLFSNFLYIQNLRILPIFNLFMFLLNVDFERYFQFRFYMFLYTSTLKYHLKLYFWILLSISDLDSTLNLDLKTHLKISLKCSFKFRISNWSRWRSFFTTLVYIQGGPPRSVNGAKRR